MTDLDVLRDEVSRLKDLVAASQFGASLDLATRLMAQLDSSPELASNAGDEVFYVSVVLSNLFERDVRPRNGADRIRLGTGLGARVGLRYGLILGAVVALGMSSRIDQMIVFYGTMLGLIIGGLTGLLTGLLFGFAHEAGLMRLPAWGIGIVVWGPVSFFLSRYLMDSKMESYAVPLVCCGVLSGAAVGALAESAYQRRRRWQKPGIASSRSAL